MQTQHTVAYFCTLLSLTYLLVYNPLLQSMDNEEPHYNAEVIQDYFLAPDRAARWFHVKFYDTSSHPLPKSEFDEIKKSLPERSIQCSYTGDGSITVNTAEHEFKIVFGMDGIFNKKITACATSDTLLLVGYEDGSLIINHLKDEAFAGYNNVTQGPVKQIISGPLSNLWFIGSDNFLRIIQFSYNAEKKKFGYMIDSEMEYKKEPITSIYSYKCGIIVQSYDKTSFVVPYGYIQYADITASRFLKPEQMSLACRLINAKNTNQEVELQESEKELYATLPQTIREALL